MTYNIAWVQPNFQQGPKEFNAYYLPYSAGVIWSYSLADPAIRERFKVTEFLWRREAIEETAERLCQNDMVAFSTYVWNHRYNYELARQIKARNPNTVILFGGPEPAITDVNIFRDNPFMDLIICKKNITFRRSTV